MYSVKLFLKFSLRQGCILYSIFGNLLRRRSFFLGFILGSTSFPGVFLGLCYFPLCSVSLGTSFFHFGCCFITRCSDFALGILSSSLLLRDDLLDLIRIFLHLLSGLLCLLLGSPSLCFCLLHLLLFVVP